MKFLFCLCITTIDAFAQKTDYPDKKNSIFIGAGNYEYLNVGFNTSIKQKHYVELALGIKPWGFDSSKFQMAYLCLGTKLFKERVFAHFFPVQPLNPLIASLSVLLLFPKFPTLQKGEWRRE